MRIMINALSARSGGAQTYLRNVVPFLALRGDIELIILTYKQFSHLYSANNVRVMPLNTDPGNVLARSFWEKFLLPGVLKRERIDIYYAPGGIVACKVPPKCKTAVAFQNMLPFSETETARYTLGYDRVRYWILRIVQSKAFRNADIVVFISHYAKHVIDQRVSDRKGKSVVIWHGIEKIFKTPSTIALDCRLRPGEYVLYVSPIKPYKAHKEVLRAWKLFCENVVGSYSLVFAGIQDSSYAKDVVRMANDFGLGDRVLFLGHVPYHHLPVLYQNARINIFASSCENCPNILIEALNSGRPVFCSNIPPMPEFGGSELYYFDPYNPEELSDLLIKYIENDAALDELGHAASQRGAIFDWQRSADELYEAFLSL
jgi:glycosyltransferase involved in cell wall biosynthesis